MAVALIRSPFHQARSTAHLLRWIYLAAALALIAISTLTPTWLQQRQLARQHRVLELQRQHLQRQHDAYQQFLEAAQRRDPLVIRHLAYSELHLKPAGAEVLDTAVDNAAPLPLPPADSINAWLHRPLPQMQGISVPSSRLVRLTRSPARLVLIAAAGLCLFAALCPVKN